MKTSKRATTRSIRLRLAFIATSIMVVGAIVTSVALTAPLPGAIFTTDFNCNGTDLNIYASKADVYVDGGPAHMGAAGLPAGEYYIQVTEPDGTLLGTSIGTNDETPVVVNAQGEFVSCYKLVDVVRAASNPGPYPVAPDGYDTTSNPGGEYKVWVSRVSDFANDETKTDNFKVKTDTVQTGTLNVFKYYDTDTSGTFNAGDVEIVGWAAIAPH